jgi:dihydroorotase
MDILLTGGRVIDPKSGTDRKADVLIVGGKIARIEAGQRPPSSEVRVVHVPDRIIAPGFVDLHVHFREPGHEYKEDIESGSRAAAAGGFTTVCCMPNTTPPNDNRAVTDLILKRAREVDLVRIRPLGAVSKGLAGESMSEMGEMRDAGIIAVSDDGLPIMNAELMRRAMEYARTFGLPVVQHAEDLNLVAGGVMNEGEVATRLGLRGQPPSAESSMVARDLELCTWTGARYHVAHMSTARTVELIADAKRRGMPVSCEVTPHHLALTDAACCSYDTNTKVAPPLRSEADVGALKQAIADGIVDAIATDHAPHSDVEKELEYDHAAFGMVGLETALPILMGLCDEGALDVPRMIELLTSRPAACFGLDREGVGSLALGAPADVVVLDLDRRWTIDRAAFRSKARNTPFHGRSVRGRALLTLVGGKVVHDEDRTLT